MPAERVSAAELRRLIALLERSPQAQRPEGRALLERSRRLLAAMPPPRRERGLRRALGKLGRLGLLGLDAGALGLLGFALAVAALGPDGLGPLAVGLAPAAAWLVLRFGPGLEPLREAALVLHYHLRWAADWFAEAASAAAERRMAARHAARVLLRGWREEARRLRRPAGLADLGDWLAAAYGAHVAAAFAEDARRVLAADPPGERAPADAKARRARHDAARLRRLGWLALMRHFARLADSGVLWQAPAPAAAAPVPDSLAAPSAPEPAGIAASESAELQRRRDSLAEQIRRKRAEVERAYTWQLRTPGEIANREAFQQGLREEIAVLERELAALGGAVGPRRGAGARGRAAA